MLTKNFTTRYKKFYMYEFSDSIVSFPFKAHPY